jgi:membrane fusion protein (multidrug efflux system)
MSQAPQPGTSPTPSTAPDLNAPSRFGRNLRLFSTIAVCALAIAAVPSGVAWVVYRSTHSITNDAFVESHIVNLAPRVEGQLVQIHVQERDAVKKGQLLTLIDPAPFERQVAVARARLAAVESELSRSETALVRLRQEVPKRISIAARDLAIARDDHKRSASELALTSNEVQDGVVRAKAQLSAANAAYVQTQEDYKRFTKLVEQKSSPTRRLEEVTRAFKVADADVTAAQAGLSTAEAKRRRIDIAKDDLSSSSKAVERAEESLALAKVGDVQIEEAQRTVAVQAREVESARRELQLAETTLSYTRMVAPFDGVVVKRYRHLGDFAKVGSPVLSLYNPELLYVTANMEETRLRKVSPGNAVHLKIDAFSEPFRGRVVWVNKATAANFALVPRDVSAGEFTKVVQRVPIRIWIEKDDRWPLLQAGLSVTVSIAHGEGDPAWAAAANEEYRRLETEANASSELKQ